MYNITSLKEWGKKRCWHNCGKWHMTQKLSETIRLKIKKEPYIKSSLVGKGVSHSGRDEQF